jgi:SpoVK/Ycf46/Vps4 family AAA+-type ATPase
MAAKFNRPLIQVSVAQIKDPYVGNSERNVEEVFKQYKIAVDHFTKFDKKLGGKTWTPILYIDEFESLIPERTGVDSSSAGNMLANMTAIFLTEIERLEGILLLSTNLPTTTDAALNRRINFKFNFPSFNRVNQKKVMQLYFKGIDEQIIDEILSEVDLNPGNMVNMKKAYLLESIFAKEKTSSEQIKSSLLEIAKREIMVGGGQHKQVLGFKIN